MIIIVILLFCFIFYFQCFRIKPPMCITKEDVDFAVSVFKEAIEKNSS